MLRKLHTVIVKQDQYQRSIPIVSAALIIKQIYQIGWNVEQNETSDLDQGLVQGEISKVAACVCGKIRKEACSKYVDSGKCSSESFAAYIDALEDILLDEFTLGDRNDGSYFETLRGRLPELTKEEYTRKHRITLEYLAKTGKKRMRDELRKS
jgi:hypothetical protein